MFWMATSMVLIMFNLVTVYIWPMTEVASKWLLLLVLFSLQWVASSSWKLLLLLQRLAYHVRSTSNSLFEMVYLR